MLVSPIHRHTATLNVCIHHHQKKSFWWWGLVPSLVKWLLPIIIWLSYDYQKSKEDLLMTVASGGEVGTSCEWRPPVPVPDSSWTLAPSNENQVPPLLHYYCASLSIFLSLSLFATRRFCRFFSLLKLRCPWPPPSFTCLFLVWTNISANCPQCFSSCPFSASKLLHKSVKFGFLCRLF